MGLQSETSLCVQVKASHCNPNKKCLYQVVIKETTHHSETLLAAGLKCVYSAVKLDILGNIFKSFKKHVTSLG